MKELVKLAIDKGYTRLHPQFFENSKLEPKTELLEMVLLQQYLIDEHNIHVCPTPKYLYPDNAITGEYHCDVNISEIGDVGNDGVYWGYKEALKAGLIQALKTIK